MSEIQSIEGRPIKKGMSPGRRSAVLALAFLVVAAGILAVGQLVQPAPIPADRTLGLILANGSIALARPDGSHAVPLAGSGVPTDAGQIRLAPGGDFVAVRIPTGIVVIDRAGVVSWRQAMGTSVSGGLAPGSFAWAPDGSQIAILDPNGGFDSTGAVRASLQILSSIGELAWDVPLPDRFHVVDGFANLAWSPEGAVIAVTGYVDGGLVAGQQSTAVWLVDLEAQSVTRVTEEGRSFSYAPAWSGTTLLIARESPLDTGVWRIRPPNDAGDRLLQTGPVCSATPCPPAPLNPTPAPDPTVFAYRAPIIGLSIYDTSTGQSTRVQQAGSVAGDPFEWTPDGASLLFVRRPANEAVTDQSQTLVRYDVAPASTTDVLTGVQTFDLLPSAP